MAAVSGVRMSNQRKASAKLAALRRLAAGSAVLAALAPPVVHAQVNIDQDKTPAHIYASDCALCHKSIRGLANGRSRAALTGYLAEHYTASEAEAASLAAFVLSAGGGVGRPVPAHNALTVRDTAGGRDARRSQNRLPAAERGGKQRRVIRRPAQQKPAGGPTTATAAPPTVAPSKPPAAAAPATAAPSGGPASDNIAD